VKYTHVVIDKTLSKSTHIKKQSLVDQSSLLSIARVQGIVIFFGIFVRKVADDGSAKNGSQHSPQQTKVLEDNYT